jgi:hypothetical protein
VRNPNLFLNDPTTASNGMQMNRKGRFAQIVCNLSVCSCIEEFEQIAAMKRLTKSGSRKNEIQDVPF